MPKLAPLGRSFRASGSLKPRPPKPRGPRPPKGPNPVPKSVQDVRRGGGGSKNPFANVEDVKVEFDKQKEARALARSKREDKALGTIGRFGRKVANKQKEARALAQSRKEDKALGTIGRFGRRAADRASGKRMLAQMKKEAATPKLGKSVYDTQDPNLLKEIRAVGQGRRETAAANTIGRFGRSLANKAAGKRMRAEMSGRSVGRPVIPSSEGKGGALMKRARTAAGKAVSGVKSLAGKVASKVSDPYTKLLLGTAATGAIARAIADDNAEKDAEKRKKVEDAARARAQNYG